MIAYSGNLKQFNLDNGMNHEGYPRGVPVSYDWRTKPKFSAWNAIPAGYAAFTGWGQVFFDAGAPSAPARFELRNLQVFGHQPDGWVLCQDDAINGNVFYSDFRDNATQAPLGFQPTDRGASVQLQFGNFAYHFWPRSRAILPVGFDALLVMVEARAIDSDALLIGGGADYWQSLTAPYPNNKGVGVGRLKRLSRIWDCYGFTTATQAQLAGFVQA